MSWIRAFQRAHDCLFAESGESAAIDRVRMCGAEDIWARRVDRGVDHEGGGVEESHGPRFIKNISRMVDEDKIVRLDK